MGFIYALADPRTLEIRYIGKTEQTVERRLVEHVRHARAEKKRARIYIWIRALEREGLLPVALVLDERPDRASLNEAERQCIALFRESGARLVNHTDGGDGGDTGGNKHPKDDEYRKKISEGLKKYHAENPGSSGIEKAAAVSYASWQNAEKSEVRRARISESLRAHNRENRDKVLARARGAERREKIGAAVRKRYEDPEERLRTGAAVAAAMTPEVRAKISAGNTKPRDPRPCVHCGKVFTPTKQQRRDKRTCSEECRWAYIGAKMRSGRQRRRDANS